MSAAWPRGKARRFIAETKLRPELGYGGDSGGWSEELEEHDLAFSHFRRSFYLLIHYSTACSLS